MHGAIAAQQPAGAWTPAALSPRRWYDANDAATLHVTAPPKLDSWDDKGSDAAHLTGWNQPRTGVRTIGGKNAIDLVPALSAYLERTGASTIPQPFTAFCVAAIDDASKGRVWDAVSPRALVMASDKYGAYAGSILDAATAPALGAAFSLVVVFNGASTKVYAGGALLTTGNAGTNGAGTPFLVGYDGGGTLMDGAVAEIVIAAGDQTAAVPAWETYVTSKWFGAFNPASIAGLVGWYDAADLATITATAGRVSAWADKSASAWNATQGTAANQPLTGTATLGGKNAIRFAVSRPDALYANVTAAGNTGTWFAAFNPSGAPSYGRLLSLDSGAADYDNAQSIAAMIRRGSDPAWGMFYNNNLRAPENMANGAHVLCTKRAGDGTTTYVDGATTGQTFGSGTAAFASVRLGIGANYPVSSAPTDADVGEILWYSTALSDADRIAVQNYLKTKWGTP